MKGISLDKKKEMINERIIRDKSLFEQEGNYYKPLTISNFYSKSQTDYESNGDRNKTLSVKEYLQEIKPYLKDIKNNFKKSDTLKIQLTIPINFIFSKNTDEERVIHSKSDNMETISYDKVDEIIEKPIESLIHRYQILFVESTKDSTFIFHCVNFLHYKCHKINLKRSGLYIDFPDWRKYKKKQR